MRTIIAILILLLPTSAFAAIAFDTAQWTNVSADPLTFTGHATAANEIGFVCIQDSSNVNVGTNIAAVTWNGVEMSTGTAAIFNTNVDAQYMFYIQNPPAGSSTISITRRSATFSQFGGYATYSGADTSASPLEAQTVSNSTSSLTMNKAITTTTDNDWGMYCGGTNQGVNGVASGYTARIPANNTLASAMGDSAGVITPAGATTPGFTVTPAANNGIVAWALKPAAVSAFIASTWWFMLF